MTNGRLRIIWEVTLSMIVLAVTGSTLYVATQRSLFSPGETTAFLLLSNGFFLVIGFYLGYHQVSRREVNHAP